MPSRGVPEKGSIMATVTETIVQKPTVTGAGHHTAVRVYRMPLNNP